MVKENKIIKVRDGNCEDGEFEFYLSWNDSFNRSKEDEKNIKELIRIWKDKQSFYIPSELVKALNLFGFKVELVDMKVDMEL